MYHDGTRFNTSTGFPPMEVVTTYSPAYAPVMQLAPEIDPASSVYRNVRQAQDWLTVPSSSTIAQPSGPSVTYREIRPKQPHKATPASHQLEPEEEEKHSHHRDLGRRKHAKHRKRQLGPKRARRTARNACRTVSEVPGTTSLPARDSKTRSASLYFRTCILCSAK